MLEIFISYSSYDRVRVSQLARELGELGYSVWHDQRLVGGQRWWPEIIERIHKCDLFIIALTPNSMKSEACAAEIAYANALNKRILPVLLAETERQELLPVLKSIQFVDSREFSRESMLALINTLNRLPPPEALPNPLPEPPPEPLPEQNGLTTLENQTSRRALEKFPAILIVGSGVGEKALRLKAEPRLGQKQTADEHQELYGGSGVNYSLRLGHTGYHVLPVLSIGNDWTGRKIQDEIFATANHEQVADFIGSDEFLCCDLSTPESLVLIAGGQRTIFTSKLRGFDKFGAYVDRRIDQIDELSDLEVKAVMVGHIYADSPEFNSGFKGRITRQIIERYADRDVFIFTNLGRSQFEMGNNEWRDILRHVTVFQLALDEARAFFHDDPHVNSLRDMIEWFQQQQITALITMDRVGAIATLKDGSSGVIFARPYDLDARLVDTTGAGDAFGAGLVSFFIDRLLDAQRSERHPANKRLLDQLFTMGYFEDAIDRARNWAAYCCMTMGGASHCPTLDQLDALKTELGTQMTALVKKGSLSDFNDIMWLIDRAY